MHFSIKEAPSKDKVRMREGVVFREGGVKS